MRQLQARRPRIEPDAWRAQPWHRFTRTMARCRLVRAQSPRGDSYPGRPAIPALYQRSVVDDRDRDAAAAQPPLRGSAVDQLDQSICLQSAAAAAAQISGTLSQHGGDGGSEPSDRAAAVGSVRSRDPQQPRTMAEIVLRSARTDQIRTRRLAAI